MISFSCPHCNKALRVKDELAGKRGKCPGCGQAFAIPATSASAAAPAQGADPAEMRTLPPVCSAWSPSR